MTALFPDSFVQGIQQLRLAARRVPAGTERGEHDSRHAGTGMDFHDYRQYAPGDDLRRVDWNIYRRSGRLMLRQFQEPRRLAVHVLLDVSDSMFFEDPPRADAGRQVAVALVAAALHQHDRVSVHPIGNGIAQPLQIGQRGLPPLLAALERLGPSGSSELGEHLRRFAAMRQRPGLAVIISDFFDPAGVDALIDGMSRLRHRLLLVQLVRASDAAPELNGDLELVDCETGAPMRVNLSSQALATYREAYRTFNEKLSAFAAGRNARLVQIDADVPVLNQLGRLAPGGVLRI